MQREMRKTTMREQHLIHVALFFICCCALNVQLVCSVKGTPGWVIPERVELPIGSDLNISCTIDKAEIGATCNAKQLYFKMNTELGGKDINYTTDPDIWYINDTTILFKATNLSERDASYVCMCGQNGIDTSRVFVGTKPAKVMNFECTSYDWDYMFCNFTTPKNSIITKYNVSFETQRNSSYRYYVDCNFDASPIVNCNITQETYKKFSEYYYFRLDITNSLGHETQDIPVNNYERMILAKPGQNLQKINYTKDSICLSWEMPRRSNFIGGVLWKVFVTPENFSSITRPMWRNNSSALRNILCLTELPFAGYKYLLELRVRNNKNGSRWSQPLNYEFRTASERPDRPPRITNGSFYIYSSESQLSIYWEQLEKQELNGDNFSYVISEYRVNGTITDSSKIKMDMNSATIENWNKSVKHELLIRSSNNVNTSVEASRLIIPAISSEDTRVRMPKKIRSVYHSSNSSYTLSWKAPDNSTDLINYTVFWCNSKPALQSKCNGSIHFENVSKDRLQFTTKSAQPTSLNMAVSANYGTTNTGMHWMSCSRDVYDDLAKMEPSIEEITNSSLSVKWSTERVCPAILSGYNLTYCHRPAGKPDNCTTKVLDSNAVDYTIHNLEPYTYYSVKMFMYSTSRASKYSDELINRTGEAAPTQPRQLEFSNVSSSGVLLSWKPPLKANGVVRAYEGTFHHNNKTEHFKLPASTDELVDNEKRVSFELGNLTAYTDYEITIRARTLYSSEPSNVIRFRTAVGVPSSPGPLLVDNTQLSTSLEWTAPPIPAGRVEYYEVSIIQRDANNSLISQTSSYIGGKQNRSCVMQTPVCIPLYRFHYQVRAVNAELLQSENHEEDDSELDKWSRETQQQQQQQCVAQPPLSGIEWSIINSYGNESRYRLHKSNWAIHEVSCSPDRSSTQLLISSAELIVAAIIIAAACHMAYKKLQKMSDIDLELPSGLKETLKKPLELDMPASGGIVCTRLDPMPQYMPQYAPQEDMMPHDFSGSGNESSKLLLANNSGSNCCADEEHTQMGNTLSLPLGVPVSYMPMRQDLLQDHEEQQAHNGNQNYIKPTQLKQWSANPNNPNNPGNANANPSLALPLSGYVPVQVLQARPMPPVPSSNVPVNAPASAPVSAPPLSLLNSSNYVQAADLHKLPATVTAGAPTTTAATAAPPTNSFGYTAMEQLIKPSTVLPNYTQPIGQTATTQHRMQPNIGGYVTPQDLNAIAHNRHML
ncbi:cytokine receptor [Drosophila innubila]|uniref:cytokine receptor n=1 Tax=Drosophila innubila TaxID=198719 RepID=UPI00148E421A|nr:cytokine receptor [Drosophila innubila]